MDFKQFTQDAIRTESRPEKVHINPGLMVSTMVLAVLAAQALDIVKKAAFYGKPLDLEDFGQKINAVNEHALEVQSEIDLGKPENRDKEDVILFDPSGKEVKVTDANVPVRLSHAFIGMMTESGELLEALLTSIITGQPVDRVNVGEEFGDADWYKGIAFDVLGLDEPSIRAAVIAKLKARYGDKFDADKAVNRDLIEERRILENGVA